MEPDDMDTVFDKLVKNLETMLKLNNLTLRERDDSGCEDEPADYFARPQVSAQSSSLPLEYPDRRLRPATTQPQDSDIHSSDLQKIVTIDRWTR